MLAQSLQIHSGCNDLPNGLHYIKATTESPVIPVICSNAATIIDPSLNVQTYLSFLKTLQLDSSTLVGTCDCKSSELTDLQASQNDLWTITIQLDKSECACYQTQQAITYYDVMEEELPMVRATADEQSEFDYISDSIVFADEDDINDQDNALYSSCLGLEDGEAYIMPDEEIGDVIKVHCDGGWTILNPALDLDAYISYFTSWQVYIGGKVSGPDFNDFATWRQWWLPAKEDTHFNVAPECSACVTQPLIDVVNPTNEVYHMTGNYYLCAWGTKGDCDMNINDECYSCVNRHGGNDYLSYMSGTCTHMISHADRKVYTHHDDCTGMSDNTKPSLGLNDKFCVCYQDEVNDDATQTVVTAFELNIDIIENLYEDKPIDVIESTLVELTMDDFAAGTYRIKRPGTYRLMEDIEFEPNGGDDDNANSYENVGWYPFAEQEDTYATGFDDYTFIGEYQLGFPAAITVECDDVVIDLNTFTIQQSKRFYIQQRFFSTIMLNSKNFIEGQGPVFFSADLSLSSNIVIKNGVIGRTSHHGILGRQTKNLLIEDVQFNNFDVAGISLSGFEDIIIRNVDVGPNNHDCPVTGRYLHARGMLPRYKQLVEEMGEKSVIINGEQKHVKSLIDTLVESMNIIYNEEILGIEYDQDDELYKMAQLEFGNPSRVSDGGVVYGVLLNGYGGAVMGLGSAPMLASNAVLENVNVHDFSLNPIEKCKFAFSNSPFTVRGPFADVFDADLAAEIDEDGLLHYVGTPFANAQLAFARLTESWSALSHADMGKRFQRWTAGEIGLDYQADVLWSCNTDIQLHVNKGPIGIRVDGINTVRMSDIEISNMVNVGILGDTEKCGSYLKGNGHQDSQVQLGYTGTDNYGLIVINSDNVVLENSLKIYGLESHYGISTALSVLRGATLTLDTTNAYVEINDVVAGSMLELNSLTVMDLPNKVPVACAVENKLGAIVLSNGGSLDDFFSIDSDSIIGHSECLDTLHMNKEIVVNVPSACNNLEDGIQYILPYGLYDQQDYPLLPVMCSDGNTILDVSLSWESYSRYFSSLYMYDIGIGGPSLEDFSDWRSWYLPFENHDIKAVFKYGVSEDCNSCRYGTDDNALSTSTAYYMTGNFYLCAWITKGDCDMDAETYECFECARHGGRSDDVYSGVCSHIETNVDFEVHDDHFECTGSNDNLKPSIGTNGQFCACYQELEQDLRTYEMNPEDFNDDVMLIEASTAPDDDGDSEDTSNDVTYLSNEDFLYGTYRITKPGIYVLTEDIVLNFNAPSDDIRNDPSFSPNSYDAFHWMPKTDGSQEDEYMGSSTWSGPYQLGFFTAVTIETSDVTIDLNEKEIGMSEEFYLQQRVFSIFELASKNFVSGQGPVDFGPYLNSAENVVIKNGIIGRASHHGIHANDANGITLSDLKIYNFDVAGIQLNGFEDITIENCDIGPSASGIPVTGRYLHARVLLRRFAHLVDNYGDEAFAFADRDEQSVRDYVDELITQMDMVYDHVINDVQYDADDETWAKATDLFINPNENGYGDGGVVYGILLNSRGGAVMGFGNAPAQSTNAVINNVNIHDLAISPLEKLKFKTYELGGATRGPVADVLDVMKVSDQFDDVSTAKYVGTAYSDVQFAMSEFEESWNVLDHTCFDDGMREWALNGVPFGDLYYGGCNTDIQLHINKGVIGLRIDNVVGFQVSNVNIESLLNTGVLGTETDVCGAYTQGNAHQDPMITAGYTGTEGYGITVTQSTEGQLTNININNIETHYGAANGVALFKDSSVDFNSISIDSIIAGSQMEMALLKPGQNYLPNKIPVACSIFDNNYNTEWTISDPDNGVTGTNINGYLICSDEQLIGDCDGESCSAMYDSDYFDGLAETAMSTNKLKSAKSIAGISNAKKNHSKSFFERNMHTISVILIMSSMIIIFMAACCYYRCSEYDHIKSPFIASEKYEQMLTSEKTPLLTS